MSIVQSTVTSSIVPMQISLHDYAQAVSDLVTLANQSCGSARVAAQVLLGIYNGRGWHVNLQQLIALDGYYYQAAMIAIRGRIEFNIEPHDVIEDGDAVFDQLQDDWKPYHVKNRYKNH